MQLFSGGDTNPSHAGDGVLEGTIRKMAKMNIPGSDFPPREEE